MAVPKARTIPVIIINTNRYNVWIRQPLLAAKVFDVECDEMEYRSDMNWDGDIGFGGLDPIPPIRSTLALHLTFRFELSMKIDKLALEIAYLIPLLIY